MGRYRQFDETELLEKAMKIFRRHGYAGTSMRDLEAELAINPGSIYSAFGNKKSLYIGSLELCHKLYEAQLQKCVAEQKSFFKGLEQYLRDSIFHEDVKTCMVVKTLGGTAKPEDPDIKNTAVGIFEATRKLFAKLLLDAHASGEIPMIDDAEDIAGFIQVQMNGLCTFADSRPDQSTLINMVDHVMDAIRHRVVASGVNHIDASLPQTSAAVSHLN